ncbi:MAG TPA: class I SAM-dependent methyltransferase [Armatimonadota bacterium]|jgi:SAM-dependent methyltransferase
MASRIAKWREAAVSMHPAGWLWAFMHKNPTPKRFDLLYKLGKGDPWRTQNAPYEDRKRADLLSLLRERYTSILDVGCGTGTLTRLLAQRGPVLGVDASAVAIEHARQAGGMDVAYEAADLTKAELAGPYDLVVASEVLYYLVPEQREAVIGNLARALSTGGQFVVAGGKGDDRVIPLLEMRPDLKFVAEVVRDEDVWRPYRIALFEKV